MYGMSNKASRAILRAKSPDALYADICRIACEDKLFQFAAIYLHNPIDQDLKSLASTSISDDAALEAMFQTLASEACTQGTNCVRRMVPSDASDTSDRPHVNPGGTQSDTVPNSTAIALPLRDAHGIVAVLLLYTEQVDLFDPLIRQMLEGIAEDISLALEYLEADQRRLAAEAKLHYRAFYDAQTGLPNGTMLEERLFIATEQAKARNGLLTLIDIRLQRVEQILQLLGNSGMDEVLRTLAARLEHFGGTDAVIAQLAHDEFALVSHDQRDGNEALELARQVQVAFQQAVCCGDKEIFVQTSVGCVVYPLHETEVRYLLRRARAAAARHDSEFGVRLYSPDLDSGLEQGLQMAAELHRALERNEFELYYQPQLDLRSGEMVGVETLLRWKHPRQGIISPALFVPMLEDLGLMPEVGTWVLRSACKQAKTWQNEGYKSLRVAVNLSAQQFHMADLVPIVSAALSDAQLEPECLELELTESLILESAERTIQTMHELKKLGVSLSLDDFGTGYSCLNYLRHYPVDRIKIDQSFVRDMTEHAGSAALVRSILAMACNLGMTAIAEGVETVGQYGYLRKQLCQEMQGFLFSRPVPMPELTRILQEERKFQDGETELVDADIVLLVDDEPNVLAAMRRVFRRESWKLLTAADAHEGFELLARHNIGVVISDLRMNGISGAEFLYRVREMYPNTMRLLLTGYNDFTTVIDAVNRGDLYKVLSKPVDDNILRDSIRDAFRRYTWLMRAQQLSLANANAKACTQ
jgi:diguanylate cyclase (GGDEF)-like protein